MKKLVKFVLPIAFVAGVGVGLMACEEKPKPPAKPAATPPAGAPSTPPAGGETKPAEKK